MLVCNGTRATFDSFAVSIYVQFLSIKIFVTVKVGYRGPGNPPTSRSDDFP